MQIPWIVFTILIIYCANNANSDGLVEVFGWKQMGFEGSANDILDHSKDIAFPGLALAGYGQQRIHPDADRFQDSRPPHPLVIAAGNSDYIAYNNVPMGTTHFKGRLFITVPRRRTGIPSTLNYIDMKAANGNPSPLLRAYPDVETNTLNPSFQPDDKKLISVYRTRVDVCNRLWFIDTGMLEYPNNRTQVQRPSIWIIDLNTDRVLNRIEIPESIVAEGRGLASITVDVDQHKCDDAYAYIPDLVHYSLYVLRLRDNHMWTFQHNSFNFDPLQGDLNIGGQRFEWNDGIFSITLGNKRKDGFRTAFFHPMASTSEFAVSTQVLRNESNAQRSYHGNDFMFLGNRGPMTQSTMHDFDPRTGVIFYDFIAQNGVGCWNTRKPFSEQTHGNVQSNAQTMIYPSDLTIDTDGVIWVMTNSMPIFIYSDLNPDEVNFRVWKQSVSQAVKNTPCGK